MKLHYLDICKYIIEYRKSRKKLDFEDTRLLKLMKLVYMSHGFFLALEIEPFIEKDSFEAWAYGPVLRSLFDDYKRGTHDDFLNLVNSQNNEINGDEKIVLDMVCDRYTKLETFSLVALTHSAGSPWQEVYRGCYTNIIIPDALIKKYYQNLLDPS